MKVTITIEGDYIGEVTRTFQSPNGWYDELYNRDWNERVRDFLDDVKKYDDDKAKGIEL